MDATGKFSVFIRRLDVKHEALMMNTRWYPIVVVLAWILVIGKLMKWMF